MEKVTSGVIYRELLVLDEQFARVTRTMTDNPTLLREMNEEFARGRAMIEAAKQRYGYSDIAGGDRDGCR